MNKKLHLVLLIFLPNILSLPIEMETFEESENKIDHGNNADQKNFTDNKETFDSTIPQSEISSESEDSSDPQVTWLISPITQKVQLSPQTLFRERLGSLKNTLTNFGTQNVTSKNLPVSLLQMVGFNDATLISSQGEHAGVLGGNGWLTNKGGILGGPGAILSTGSFLTDYPTAYKK